MAYHPIIICSHNDENILDQGNGDDRVDKRDLANLQQDSKTYM